MALTQHAQPDGPGRLTFRNCAFDLLITFPTLAYTVFGSLLLVLEDIPNKVGILLLRICSQLPADVSSLASGTPSPQLSLLSLGLRVSGASLIYLGLVAGARGLTPSAGSVKAMATLLWLPPSSNIQEDQIWHHTIFLDQAYRHANHLEKTSAPAPPLYFSSDI